MLVYSFISFNAIIIVVVKTLLLSSWHIIGHLGVVNAFAASFDLRRGMARRRNKGGFGVEKKEKEDTTNNNNNNHKDSIYSKPSLYDLAFGYRNYEEEVAFLVEASGLPSRILELAAGPARHSLTGLTWDGSPSIIHATAVDISEHMKEYAIDLAKNSYTASSSSSSRPPFAILNLETKTTPTVQSTFQYVLQDMRHLQLTDTFDSAWILLGSMQHLLTNTDVLQCFHCIYNVLTPNGTLIIELPHPQETFTMIECTKNAWKVPLEISESDNSIEEGDVTSLNVQWGGEKDMLDPIAQVRNLTVLLELVAENTNTKKTTSIQKISQVVPTRLFTAQEIDALARGSGFEVVAMYGALDKDISIHDPELAYRMVCVLRKK